MKLKPARKVAISITIAVLVIGLISGIYFGTRDSTSSSNMSSNNNRTSDTNNSSPTNISNNPSSQNLNRQSNSNHQNSGTGNSFTLPSRHQNATNSQNSGYTDNTSNDIFNSNDNTSAKNAHQRALAEADALLQETLKKCVETQTHFKAEHDKDMAKIEGKKQKMLDERKKREEEIIKNQERTAAKEKTEKEKADRLKAEKILKSAIDNFLSSLNAGILYKLPSDFEVSFSKLAASFDSVLDKDPNFKDEALPKFNKGMTLKDFAKTHVESLIAQVVSDYEANLLKLCNPIFESLLESAWKRWNSWVTFFDITPDSSLKTLHAILECDVFDKVKDWCAAKAKVEALEKYRDQIKKFKTKGKTSDALTFLESEISKSVFNKEDIIEQYVQEFRKTFASDQLTLDALSKIEAKSYALTTSIKMLDSFIQRGSKLVPSKTNNKDSIERELKSAKKLKDIFEPIFVVEA